MRAVLPGINDQDREVFIRDENGEWIVTTAPKTYKDYQEWKLQKSALIYTDATSRKHNKLSASTGEDDGSEPTLIGSLGEIKLSEAVKQLGEIIRNEDAEYVCIIDHKGDIYANVGNAESISLGTLNLKGASIIHNHPEANGILSYGKDDFEFLQNNIDIECLYLVNKCFDYYVKPLEKIKKAVYGVLYADVLSEVNLDEIDDLYDVQHDVMMKLKKMGCVEYERKRI